MNPDEVKSDALPAAKRKLFEEGSPSVAFETSSPDEAIQPALKILKDHGTLTEVADKRAINAKTFQTANEGEYRVVIDKSPIHYTAPDGSLQDIDLTILQSKTGTLFVDKAPYAIELFTDRVGYKLTQPDGTWASIELTAVGGTPVDNSKLTAEVDTVQVFYEGILPSLHFKILLRPDHPEIFTKIDDASAPRSFTWLVNQSGNFSFVSSGADANGSQ